MTDQVNLNDDGGAEFDITDRETGEAVTYDALTQLLYDDEPDAGINRRHRYRCHKCGSENCAVDNQVSMGSSWTGMYGVADLACNDCGASRILWEP